MFLFVHFEYKTYIAEFGEGNLSIKIFISFDDRAVHQLL